MIRRLDAWADRWGGGLQGPLPRRTGLVIMALFTAIGAIPLGASLWNARHDRRVAAALESGGDTADGQIVEVRATGRLREISGEGVKVAFRTAEGTDVTTWVTVDDAPERGRVRVRYLLRNPSVARLVDDPVPRDGLAPVLVGVGFLVSFAVPMAYHVRREWSGREVRAGPVG